MQTTLFLLALGLFASAAAVYFSWVGRKSRLKKYAVTIEGRNFLIDVKEGGRMRRKRMGFFTTVPLELAGPSEAEARAILVLQQDRKLKKAVRNELDDPPMLYLDRIVEVPSFKGVRGPRQGLAFYPDTSAKPKK